MQMGMDSVEMWPSTWFPLSLPAASLLESLRSKIRLRIKEKGVPRFLSSPSNLAWESSAA
jgi:hypothetical protein